MCEYIDRMVKEEKQLNSRISKLENFLNEGQESCLLVTYSPYNHKEAYDKELMTNQLKTMREYQQILLQRIRRAK